jgi:membrane associated rhomboid family serine protease
VQGRGYQSGGVSFGPPVTPPIVKQLLIANVVVFVAQTLVGPVLTWSLSIIPELFWHQGYLWQPFTYMWLHSPGSLWHIGFNMLALWMFGSPLALVWGERRFLRFYLICGVGAGFIIVTWPALFVLFGLPAPASYGLPTLGASGAVYGVLLAYSLTWPDRTIMLLFPPIPIKALYFIPFILGMSVCRSHRRRRRGLGADPTAGRIFAASELLGPPVPTPTLAYAPAAPRRARRRRPVAPSPCPRRRPPAPLGGRHT